jgi:NitT/TauT family transport system permease protein
MSRLVTLPRRALLKPEPPVPATSRRRWLGHAARLARQIGLPLLLAAAVLLAWEVGTRMAHVSAMTLVPPSAVWQVLSDSWPILLQQSWPTLVEALVGFAAAVLVGVVLGSAMVLSRRLRQALWPHILLFQLIPKVALAPLFIIWLGVGPSSRLAFAVFLGFFPMVVATATGLLSAERDMLRLCRALTATPWQAFWAIRVPYALPHIFAGLKVSVTMTLIGVIVGEFVTAQEGLGYIIMFASSAAETALIFAAIFLLCVIGLAMYGLIAGCEWLVQRWVGVNVTTSEF